MNQAYYILSQYPNDVLVIGIRGQSKCLRRRAAEILAEPRLLAGLSAKDIDLIKAIASMAARDDDKLRGKSHLSKDCI